MQILHNLTNEEIQTIKSLSTFAIANILKKVDHVVMSSLECREDFEGVLIANIKHGYIDPIDLLIEKAGE